MPTDVLQFPSERIVYGNINPVSPNTGSEPLFVSDVQIAVQQAFDAAMAALGIDPTTDIFYIISGLNYSGGTYSSGVIYFKGGTSNGQFYAVNNSFAEGNALLPDSPTQSFNRLYGDNVQRNTYETFTASPATAGTGTTIAFTGNMNAYRLGNKSLQAAIIILQGIAAALGTAANLNWSATPLNGTVPIWDALFSQAQCNALFLQLSGGTMTGAITLPSDPSSNLQAATKQYVDNNRGLQVLAKGYTQANFSGLSPGDLPSSTQTQVIPLGITTPESVGTNYKVVLTLVNTNTTNGMASWCIDETTQTSTSFTIRLIEVGGGTQNVFFDWFIVPR
jgi:hypothetical protein